VTDQKAKNQPTPKPKASAGTKLVRMVVVFVLVLGLGSLGYYSAKLGSPPWSWSHDDWMSFLQFSKEKANVAKDRISDATKDLIDRAPGLIRRIEEKLGTKPASSGPATTTNGSVPDPSASSTPAAPQESEYKAGLKCMRDGIEHYRSSGDDPGEIKLALASFKEAKDHFEKALKETQDDGTKSEISKDLNDTNRYIDDCKARSKS